MKTKKTLIILLCLFFLTGCTKILKNEENQVVKNETTGQAVTENIICKPTNKDVIKIYKDSNQKK